jgi:hypothetical protein
MSKIGTGTYNSEVKNKDFYRIETKGTLGFFAGFNVWKNLEMYVFTDLQVFDVKQKSTKEVKRMNAVTPGLGVEYQFFIGRYLYNQPALHIYVRGIQSIQFSDNTNYSISTFDFTPLVRIGIRPWKKF